jgi:Protein of unknown function (DUF1186)
MDTASYPPPVDKLLTYGDCRNIHWPDGTNYLELGFGPEHIPDLIRMAKDPELRWAYSDTLEVWAPIHAWRVLGELHAEAAIEPLLSLFEDSDEDDDWVMEELPEVYGMIGPAALPAITAYIADVSHNEWARITAASSLEKIAKWHPEAREVCITALTEQLKLFEENEPTFNAFLINDLIELKALEAAPVIKQAFGAGCVDESIQGDWEDVQYELGLKGPEENAPIPLWRLDALSGTAINDAGRTLTRAPLPKPSHEHNQKKAKNKMAKQSRKKNRKRK